MTEPHHMAKLLNFAMTDLMAETDELIMMGEDIGKKGGVYGVIMPKIKFAVKRPPCHFSPTVNLQIRW